MQFFAMWFSGLWTAVVHMVAQYPVLFIVALLLCVVTAVVGYRRSVAN